MCYRVGSPPPRSPLPPLVQLVIFRQRLSVCEQRRRELDQLLGQTDQTVCLEWRESS